MFAVSYPAESENRIGVEALGCPDVPARVGPRVVVADKTCLENEVIGDTVGKVRFVHLAASIGLRCDDVIFCVREVEPVLAALVEFDSDLRPPVILWNAVTSAQIEHVSLLVRGSFKGIASQSTERRGLAIGPEAVPVRAGEQIEVS